VLAAIFGLILLVYTIATINPTLSALSKTNQNLTSDLNIIKENLTIIKSSLLNVSDYLKNTISSGINTINKKMDLLNASITQEVQRLEDNTLVLRNRIGELEKYLTRLNSTLISLAELMRSGYKNITSDMLNISESLNTSIIEEFKSITSYISVLASNASSTLTTYYRNLENAVKEGNIEVVSNISKTIKRYQRDLDNKMVLFERMLKKLDVQLNELNNTQSNLTEALNILYIKLREMDAQLRQLRKLNSRLSTLLNKLNETVDNLKKYIAQEFENVKNNVNNEIENAKQEVLNKVDERYNELNNKLSMLMMLQVIPFITLLLSGVILYLTLQ